MSMEFNTSLEAAFANLLELSYIDMGCQETSEPQFDPVEILTHVPPCYWINAIPLHLVNIHRASEGIVKVMDSVIEATIQAKPQPEDIDSDLWIEIDDMRFHVNSFFIYADTIRDAMFMNFGIGGIKLLRSKPISYPAEPSILKEALSGVLSASMPKSEVKQAAGVLVRLYRVCKVAPNIIEQFASEPDAEAHILCGRFTRLQQNMLDLAQAIIRADAASRLFMMYSACLEKPGDERSN